MSLRRSSSSGVTGGLALPSVEASRAETPSLSPTSGVRQESSVIMNIRNEDAKDDWHFEDSYCVRQHDEPRFRLFTPLGVAASPAARSIFSVRVTRGAYCDDGQEFELVDSWRNRTSAHMSLGRPWQGHTMFYTQHSDHM